MEMTPTKFRQDKHSIKLAYKIGVFDRAYAIRKLRNLYADFCGLFTGAYIEAQYSDFYIDEEEQGGVTINSKNFTTAMETVKEKLYSVDFSKYSEVKFGNRENPISYEITRFTDIQVLRNAILSVAERCYLSNVPFTLRVYP